MSDGSADEPIGPDRHRSLRELLGVYALGRLEGDDAAEVTAHLATCRECRAETETLATVGRRLSAAAPHLGLDRIDRPFGEDEVLPPGGEERLLTAVRAHRRGHPAWRRPAVWMASAAAVAALVGAGALGYRWAPDPPVVPLEAVPVAPGPGITATADLVPHTWGVEVKLVAAGFTDGQAYRVRIIDVEGRPHPAGEFVGVGTATMRCNLNSAVLRPQARAFEVLDASGRVVLSSAFGAPA